MNRIRILPEHLVAQIAAGEVIERPAYAVKELVENALDAHATQIAIAIAESGLSEITVSDNGDGMEREDLRLSWKPHTTSKLPGDMLTAIHTLGFRGEALASIASVSRLVIQSKPADSVAGAMVTIDHGELTVDSSVGMPTGTIVHVYDLFSSTPARKKFLRSPQTEYRHIAGIVMRQALARPDVAIRLTHNGKISLDLPAGQTPADRTAGVLGEATAGLLLPMTVSDESGIRVSGFLAKPQYATSVEKHYVSINGRPVHDPLISLAVKEAYGILVEPGRFPMAILAIRLPFELVDVNVHPRKESVTISQNRLVFDLISHAVAATLTGNNISFRAGTANGIAGDRITRSIAATALREEVSAWNSELLGITVKSADIAQFHNTYLVTQTEHGILLIDQHAAHERILYEKFAAALTRQQTAPAIRTLQKPVVISLPPDMRQVLEEFRGAVTALGFSFLPGPDVTVTGVPELFADRDPAGLVREILEACASGASELRRDTLTEQMLKYLACRTAVKAGDKLAGDQMRSIIRELEAIPGAVTCPHGRPVKIEIGLRDLHKMFGRI